MKRVILLGATGSIGASAMAAIEAGEFRLVGVGANRNATALAEIARKHRPLMTVVADEASLPALRDGLSGEDLPHAAGAAAMADLAAMDADCIILAIPGFAALRPALAAVDAGRVVCLANKECLVAAGDIVMARARQAGATILPVDSEHNAIFQVYEAGQEKAIDKIVLTASGGPFRTATREMMAKATPADALKHPNWSMGAKITIDSATLMNKGLEVIEANHLFPVGPHNIDVVVHPQSVIHGMVQYKDGSCLAQLSNPSMVTPIAHCLNYPDRGPAPVPPLDLAARGTLTFEAPDTDRFPALRLAREAMHAGVVATNALNAANEVAVAAFLEGKLPFLGIAEVVEQTLSKVAGEGGHHGNTVEAVEAVDRRARDIAALQCGQLIPT
ncbi:MAG: 1-deoxy-D-xylulose-5-phosphate reductoisomerase [Pseudomonadota bacterium]